MYQCPYCLTPFGDLESANEHIRTCSKNIHKEKPIKTKMPEDEKPPTKGKAKAEKEAVTPETDKKGTPPPADDK